MVFNIIYICSNETLFSCLLLQNLFLNPGLDLHHSLSSATIILMYKRKVPQIPSDVTNTGSYHKVYHYRLKCTATFV